jgi:hypothetical protein
MARSHQTAGVSEQQHSATRSSTASTVAYAPNSARTILLFMRYATPRRGMRRRRRSRRCEYV